MNGRRRLAALVICVAVAGCKVPEVTMNDGFGLNGTSGMHQPWAVDSEVVLTAALPKRLVNHSDRLELISTDTGVFRVIQVDYVDQQVIATGLATGIGTAEVVLSKGRRELSRTPIEVSHVENGGLIPAVTALQSEDFTLHEAPMVVVDSEAYFRVQFTDGTRPVFGASLAEVSADDSLDARYDPVHLETEGDWISVRPTEKGVFPLDLLVNDQIIGNLEIEAVGEGKVVVLSLDTEEQPTTPEDTVLGVYLHAESPDGRPVFGAPVTWFVDGREAENPDPEVLKYVYSPDTVSLVTVELGDDRRASAKIHGELPRECGCATPMAPTGWWLPLAVLAAIRRRGRTP